MVTKILKVAEDPRSSVHFPPGTADDIKEIVKAKAARLRRKYPTVRLRMEKGSLVLYAGDASHDDLVDQVVDPSGKLVGSQKRLLSRPNARTPVVVQECRRPVVLDGVSEDSHAPEAMRGTGGDHSFQEHADRVVDAWIDLRIGLAEVAKALGVDAKTAKAVAAGKEIDEALCRRVQDLSELTADLRRLTGAEELPEWIREPNEAFDGEKPLDLILTRRTAPLQRMVEYLDRGGMA